MLIPAKQELSLRSLLLQLHPSIWIFLPPPCCFCSFPWTGYGIWLLWSVSGSGIWVNFPHTIQDTTGNIFIYFWYLQAVEKAHLSQCPSLQRCYFFVLFFFFPCDLSGIIKCCDCFGLPSVGIYPTHKCKSSSPELCFHSGRVVKVCSAVLWGKWGTQMSMCLGGSRVGCSLKPK